MNRVVAALYRSTRGLVPLTAGYAKRVMQPLQPALTARAGRWGAANLDSMAWVATLRVSLMFPPHPMRGFFLQLPLSATVAVAVGADRVVEGEVAEGEPIFPPRQALHCMCSCRS
jgi:hypothetical protein